MSEAQFSRRGFEVIDGPEVEYLQNCAETFLIGARLQLLDTRPVHQALEEIPNWSRGWAYEGAAMGAALVDLTNGGIPHRINQLRSADGFKYRHLIHVGIGWAAARLHLAPGPKWWGCDPLLRWLGDDGAGFQEMFFAQPEKRRKLLTTPLFSTPRQHVRGQGWGRALWFVYAADIERIAATIASTAVPIRSSLWAGVGLAAAYAGSPNLKPSELRLAGENWLPHLRQGIIFGAAARHTHEAVSEQTQETVRTIVGVDSATCASWANSSANELTIPGQTAYGYRSWQTRLEQLSETTAINSVTTEEQK